MTKVNNNIKPYNHCAIYYVACVWTHAADEQVSLFALACSPVYILLFYFLFVKIKYTFSCLNHQEPLCKVFFAFGQFISLAMIAQSQTTLETFDKIRAQKTSMD